MLPYLSFETINDDTFSNFNTGEPCILGIDEAGRGPVLGHLVYGCAIVLADKKDQLESLGVKDSKMLSPVQREKIFHKMKEAEFITYSLSVVHPRIISAHMQHQDRLSLNEISHNCTINLLQNAIQKGICIQEVFIDLVGSKEEKYQQFLKSHFPSLKITVSKKADSIFPIVGAASIAAKVTRDQLLSNWSFLESGFSKEELGSGYPSDPSTKYFISKNIDPIFGFPSLVRFSWKTIERLLEKKTVKCQWNTNELSDCPKQRTLKEIWSGIKKEGKKDNEKENAKMTRHLFFTERHISNIEHLE